MTILPHNASESARLIEELKKEIATDQNQIKIEEPKLRRIEAEIAREKAELAKKEADATHSRQHIEEIKRDLTQTEQQFRNLQSVIQKGLKQN